VDHRAIAVLVFQGRSYREIVAAAGCSHRDVSRVRKVIADRGITAQSLGALGDEEFAGLFPDGRAKVSAEYDAPDFAGVVVSMRRNRHYTVLQAWRGYAASSSTLRKYGYAQYCHLFSGYVATNDLVAVLHHEPGRAMFVDWAGDTIPLVDPVTGGVAKAYVFVAVLPFSGMVFARAYVDMKMASWLDGHMSAFESYGGVAQIVVPDNAATATHQVAKGDAARLISDRYQQMADHYGCAIVPTGVRAPRHKAAVESGVNVANMRILGYLLEETWTNIEELNEAIGERAWEINYDIRRKDGTTRGERFTTEEVAHLGPLPADRFEEVEWRAAKVQRNYHVTCDYQHYSVPYQLAGQLLRVRLTSATVTVFDGTQVVATHTRKKGRKGQYSTDPAHVPAQHQGIAGLWSRDWFLDRARTYGPATAQVITQVLDRHVIEAQGYLDCQNILEHLGKKNAARLEAACQQLLNMRAWPSYSTLKRLIAAIASDADKPAPTSPAASTRKPAATLGDGAVTGVSLRGADYYRQER